MFPQNNNNNSAKAQISIERYAEKRLFEIGNLILVSPGKKNKKQINLACLNNILKGLHRDNAICIKNNLPHFNGISVTAFANEIDLKKIKSTLNMDQNSSLENVRKKLIRYIFILVVEANLSKKLDKCDSQSPWIEVADKYSLPERYNFDTNMNLIRELKTFGFNANLYDAITLKLLQASDILAEIKAISKSFRLVNEANMKVFAFKTQIAALSAVANRYGANNLQDGSDRLSAITVALSQAADEFEKRCFSPQFEILENIDGISNSVNELINAQNELIAVYKHKLSNELAEVRDKMVSYLKTINIFETENNALGYEKKTINEYQPITCGGDLGYRCRCVGPCNPVIKEVITERILTTGEKKIQQNNLAKINQIKSEPDFQQLQNQERNLQNLSKKLLSIEGTGITKEIKIDPAKIFDIKENMEQDFEKLSTINQKLQELSQAPVAIKQEINASSEQLPPISNPISYPSISNVNIQPIPVGNVNLLANNNNAEIRITPVVQSAVNIVIKQHDEQKSKKATAPQSSQAQPKADLNQAKNQIYQSLVHRVFDSQLSIKEKIKACCTVLDMTSEEGKILFKNDASLSLFKKSNNRVLLQVLDLIEQHVMTGITELSDAQELQKELLKAWNLSKPQQNNYKDFMKQLGILATKVQNRYKLSVLPSKEVDLRNMASEDSILAARDSIVKLWSDLYNALSDSKKREALISDLNLVITTTGFGAKNKKECALDFHHQIDLAATRLWNHLKRDSNFMRSHKKFASVIQVMVERSSDIFDLRDVMYEQLSGLTLPKVEIKEKVAIKSGTLASEIGFLNNNNQAMSSEEAWDDPELLAELKSLQVNDEEINREDKKDGEISSSSQRVAMTG
ncbi:MAG: hypothetical protein HKM04_04135 [Legionellales bacterium]|nr:hypothetical protein [Legionellales bacterium]